MKHITSLLLFSILLFSCTRKDTCTDAEQTVKGEILRISGPSSLSVGERAALTVTVKADDQYCIKRAEAVIVGVQNNTVYVAANLVHTGLRAGNDCDCYNDPRIYTLIYFTPPAVGNYNFVFEKAGNWVDTTANDGGPYSVFVQ